MIEHREALIYMLCEAAEIEHAIMGQYLFAAFSFKQSQDEGLNEAELSQPLFRQHDRQSMSFTFDLWWRADVAAHADEILRRLQAGTMPCDGPWPPENVEIFKRWMQTGKQA